MMREKERSFEQLKSIGERSIGIGAGAIGITPVLVGLKLLIEGPTEHLRTSGMMLFIWGSLVVYMGAGWLEYLNQRIQGKQGKT